VRSDRSEDFVAMHRWVFGSRSPDCAAGRVQIRELLERIPEEAVRSRHFRAKNLLRESLARELDQIPPLEP
jgi:hypothetical protein